MRFETESSVRRGHPILFSAAVLFAIIELGLTAYLVNQLDDATNFNGIKSRSDFLLFTSIWTIVFSLAYIVMFLRMRESQFASVASHLGFILLTWIFWLSGAAAFTALNNGGYSCDGLDGSLGTYCRVFNATEGFAWLEFIIFTFLLFVISCLGYRATRSGDGYGGRLVA